MRLSQISIERPVLATVLSLVIALFGALAVFRLPNRELPDVDPPAVTVTTVYPGAAPEVVETSVTEPLEDEIIGIPGVRHVTSESREEVSEIRVEFEISRDLEAAANDVRDRVARARRALPEDAEEPVVAKRNADDFPIIWLALYSDHLDQIALSSLADRSIRDRLGKLPGVAMVLMSGERRFSMRIWIDGERLVAQGLTVADVAAALERENVDLPSGRLEGADREFTVRSLGELRTPTAFESLIVANRGGQPVRLSDVARVEVGPETTRKIVRFNGRPAVGLGVVKQSKANTLDVADAVMAEVASLRRELPPGVVLETAWDGSAFIRESIRDVARTILEAIGLVVLVIYAFLRSARATLIPAAAIPVSVLGAFAFLYFTGFSINTLTLMGLTLAIGLVVDDAIVVLENVARWVEGGTPPVEAARRGMGEISFAVIAATISAIAVFVPLTFLTDKTGRLFREFAVTVASALAVSGFVALTLSPALCALILRAEGQGGRIKRFLGRALAALGRAYTGGLDPSLRRRGAVVLLGVLWVAVGAWLYGRLDEELIPNSDRGMLVAFTRAPQGSTIEYTDRYQQQAERVFLTHPDVQRTFSVVALGIGTPGVVNEGFFFVSLRPRGERATPSLSALRDEIQRGVDQVPGIETFVVEPRPMRGLGAPVSLVLQGPDVHELHGFGQALVDRLEATPGFRNVQLDLHMNKPQLELEIDRDRASDLGVSVRDVATTLQILLGGKALSTFKLEGETHDVIAQLPRAERQRAEDLLGLYVRGRDGQLVSLYSVVRVREAVAPRSLPHYDRLRSAKVTARLGDGLSQGAALATARALAEEILAGAEGYRVVFAEEAEDFFESQNALLFAYGLALVFVFLVLAAQFESFVHPVIILVAVALSFTGALLALWLTDQTLNIYSKIGLVMLVGLVTKNSILIVEFANQLRARGVGLLEATREAARTRFRPILMTALATIAGILPIALGLGAGGESRAPLGIAVAGGMAFSTLLTFFVVPAVYLAVEGFREARRRRTAAVPAPAGAP